MSPPRNRHLGGRIVIKYDAVVLSHPKDYVKVSFCLDSLRFLNPSPQNIYVVSPHLLKIDSATCMKDEDAIFVKANDIKYRRKNWIYQQLIKLLQDFTENDLYMCVDSDLIFNRKLTVLKNDNPVFFISNREQRYPPYFAFTRQYLDLERQVPFTFINDFMMFDKNILKKMIPDKRKFVKDINEIVSDECLLSEFETYGNYVVKYFPDYYSMKQTQVLTHGKYLKEDPWTSDEIKRLVKNNSDKDIDLFTVHTWT